MSFHVYFSDKVKTTESGFGRVAHLPCIFDSRPGYHRLGSRHLIDRGVGRWSPKSRGQYETKPPGRKAMRNYAHWLANFLEWAEIRQVDLTTCDYAAHVLNGYQKDMVSGQWSRDGQPLSARTVNLRVNMACEFLWWLGDNGLRTTFFVPTDSRKVPRDEDFSFGAQESRTVETRIGKVRQKKTKLRMPTDDELYDWLDSVYLRYGRTIGLMCEGILLTAVRREEIVCWRLDYLPDDRSSWHINNPMAPTSEQKVRVTIRFGTKGADYGDDHGDKVGPEGDIWVPLDYAVRLDDYRRNHRNNALRLLVKSAKTTAQQKRLIKDSVHLFLDERNGKRVTAKRLYDAWTGAKCPFKGWSPHKGRDWWACSILWREYKKLNALAQLDTDAPSALLKTTALGIISLQIKPQLRHSDVQTTVDYVDWFIDMVTAGLSLDYDADLERRRGNPADEP